MRNLVYFNIPEQFFVIGIWAALTTLVVGENFFEGGPRNIIYISDSFEYISIKICENLLEYTYNKTSKF